MKPDSSKRRRRREGRSEDSLATASLLLVSGAALRAAVGTTPVPNEPPAEPRPGLGVPQRSRAPTPVAPLLQLNDKELEGAQGRRGRSTTTFLKAADEHDKRMRDDRAPRVRRAHGRAREALRRAHREDRGRPRQAPRRHDRAAREVPRRTTRTTSSSRPTRCSGSPTSTSTRPTTKSRRRLAAQEAAAARSEPPDAAAIVADYSKSLALWERHPQASSRTYRQTPSTLYLLAYYGKTKDERRSLQLFLALACANQLQVERRAADAADQARRRSSASRRKTLRDPYADCTPYPGAETRARAPRVGPRHRRLPLHRPRRARRGDRRVPQGRQRRQRLASSTPSRSTSSRGATTSATSSRTRSSSFDESVKLYDAIVAAGRARRRSSCATSRSSTSRSRSPIRGRARPTPIRSRRSSARRTSTRAARTSRTSATCGSRWARRSPISRRGTRRSTRIASRSARRGSSNPNNPLVHQEIVNAFEAKGDKFAADQAAAELATKYAPGTAWYAANEKDREAMENQRRIAERALYAAARNTHSAATQLRKDYEAVGEEGPAGEAGLPRDVRQGGRAVPPVHPDVSRVATTSTSSPSSRARRCTTASATRRRSCSTSGSAITATSARTYYLDAARSVVQSYEAERREARSPRASSQPLKVPTVAELKALPQPWQPQPIPDDLPRAPGRVRQLPEHRATTRRPRRSRASTPR